VLSYLHIPPPHPSSSLWLAVDSFPLLFGPCPCPFPCPFSHRPFFFFPFPLFLSLFFSSFFPFLSLSPFPFSFRVPLCPECWLYPLKPFQTLSPFCPALSQKDLAKLLCRLSIYPNNSTSGSRFVVTILSLAQITIIVITKNFGKSLFCITSSCQLLLLPFEMPICSALCFGFHSKHLGQTFYSPITSCRS